MLKGIVSALVVIMIVMTSGVMNGQAQGDNLIAVQLSWVHEPEFAGFYVAVTEGYYDDAGLSVDLIEGGFDDEGDYISPIDMIVSGQAQFGVSDGQTLLEARQAGHDVVMIAALFQRSPRGFMSLAENNIISPADFAGKRVVRRSDLGIVYEALYAAGGITSEDVIEITDPDLFSMEALTSGEVDATPGFTTSEAVLLRQQGYEINVVAISDYGIEDFQDILITSGSIIEEQPEMVEAFLRATLQGYDYMLDNPEDAAELVHQYAPDSDMGFLMDSMAQTALLMHPIGLHLAEIDVDAWDDLVQALIDQGVLTDKASAEGAYTVDFLNLIHPGVVPG